MTWWRRRRRPTVGASEDTERRLAEAEQAHMDTMSTWSEVLDISRRVDHAKRRNHIAEGFDQVLRGRGLI